jgi:formamidase
VAVAGAEVGDAIAIRIRDIEVTSMATSSGHDLPMEGRSTVTHTARRFGPGPGPETVDGSGPGVRCANCGADATPRPSADRLRRARALGVPSAP